MSMKSILVRSLAIACAGCASHTMADVIADKDQGRAQVYPLSEDDAWRVAVQILRWEGTDAIEQHRDEHLMLTALNLPGSGSAPGFASQPGSGAFIGAWVEPIDARSTKVTCVVRHKNAKPAGFDEDVFHARFRQALSIIQSGQALPAKAPARPPRATTLTRCAGDTDCDRGYCIEGYCRT
jgi:hypothetical protein